MRTVYRHACVRIEGQPTGPEPDQALLVDDGRIAWMGADADAPIAGASVVDLDGALITPAFVDAHVHLTSTGLALTGLDLTGAGSLREVLDRVEAAARVGRGRPIIGGGWDESRWPEQRPPTRAELDRAAYGGSVYVARVDVHSAIASSALLAAVPNAAQLTGYRPDGWVTRDAHDAVREAAYAALTARQRADAQRAALRHAAERGIACVHEMGGPAISSPDDLLAALALSRDEPVPEVTGYWGELFGIDTAIELGAIGAGGDLFCDGSLGSHTAALSAPYADADTAGSLRFDTADLAEHIRRCARRGLQAGFHAIGDAAVDQVITAAELAGLTQDGQTAPAIRIEHAEMINDPGSLAAAGLIASMQPAFDATWGGPDGMYAQRLGAERAATLNDFAAIVRAGAMLAFGSDAPVTPIDPWAGVRAAVHPHRPASAIAPHVAFAAATSGGWAAVGRPDHGRLAVGAPATFAAWEIAELTADGLPDLTPGHPLPRCIRTIRDGRTIHAT